MLPICHVNEGIPPPIWDKRSKTSFRGCQAILGKFNQGSLTTKNYNVKAGRRKANPSGMKCHWGNTIPTVRITLPRNCDQGCHLFIYKAEVLVFSTFCQSRQSKVFLT